MTVHENNDTTFLVHQIITYDYNYNPHDNVTCEMSFTPHEENMFELVDDGLYDYNCKYFKLLSLTNVNKKVCRYVSAKISFVYCSFMPILLIILKQMFPFHTIPVQSSPA